MVRFEQPALNLLFWDRLATLKRHTSRGSVVVKGGFELGSNTVQVRRGENGGAYIMANCRTQQLVWANVYLWPKEVSGNTITLVLNDHANGKGVGYKRKFDFTFFDELAAEDFFKVVTQFLPSWSRTGPSFAEMKGRGLDESGDDASSARTIDLLDGGTDKKIDCSDDDDSNDDDSNDDDSKDYKDGNETETDNNKEDEGNQEIDYLFKAVLQADSDWGNSQQHY